MPGSTSHWKASKMRQAWYCLLQGWWVWVFSLMWFWWIVRKQLLFCLWDSHSVYISIFSSTAMNSFILSFIHPSPWNHTWHLLKWKLGSLSLVQGFRPHPLIQTFSVWHPVRSLGPTDLHYITYSPLPNPLGFPPLAESFIQAWNLYGNVPGTEYQTFCRTTNMSRTRSWFLY